MNNDWFSTYKYHFLKKWYLCLGMNNFPIIFRFISGISILLRYLPNQDKRNKILEMLDDGRFFDAIEWADFVEKSRNQ